MPALHHTGQGAPHSPFYADTTPALNADLARRAFGSRLKAHREARGITLATIAATTKVNPSLLDGLERGYISRWPIGISRRAFFRDYVSAIGLPVEAMTNEFVTLFVVNDATDAAKTVATVPEPSTPLRLTLAGSARPFSFARAAIAAIDSAIIVVCSTTIALITQFSPWAVAGVLATVYYAVATTCLGRSPVAWWLQRHHRTQPTDRMASDHEPGELLLTSSQSSPSPSSPQAPVVH